MHKLKMFPVRHWSPLLFSKDYNNYPIKAELVYLIDILSKGSPYRRTDSAFSIMSEYYATIGDHDKSARISAFLDRMRCITNEKANHINYNECPSASGLALSVANVTETGKFVSIQTIYDSLYNRNTRVSFDSELGLYNFTNDNYKLFSVRLESGLKQDLSVLFEQRNDTEVSAKFPDPDIYVKEVCFGSTTGSDTETESFTTFGRLLTLPPATRESVIE